MRECKGSKIVAIPYSSFKEKLRLTRKHLNKYNIEDLGNGLNGVLYMEMKAREEYKYES